MEISYTSGLIPSIIIALLFGVCTFLLLFFAGTGSSAIGDLVERFFVISLYIILGIVIGLGFFVTCFAIFNILGQFNDIYSNYRQFLEMELGNGTLGLRIASILTGYSAIRYTINYVLAEEILWIERFVKPDHTEFPEFEKLDSRLDNVDLDIIVSSQYGIYLFAMTCLWLFTVFQSSIHTKNLVTLLNWGLFFIVDDWNIIAEYSTVLKGRVLKWHNRRVWFFNLLLIPLSISALFFNFSWFYAVICAVIMMLFLFWRFIPDFPLGNTTHTKEK